MIEYALKDKDSNLFNLNDSAIVQPAKGSLSLGNDIFTFENKIVENSALHGAVKLGKTRITSREMVITFSRALSEDYASFRIAENALLTALLSAIYLVDMTNSLQIPIAITKYPIEYNKGSYQLSSDNQITIIFLKPFWENTSVSNKGQDLIIDINEIEIINAGSLEVPPILTLTATTGVTQLQIYVDETKRGIQIDDNLFGETGYFTMIIDCKNGTVSIGTLNRIQSVLLGTGFFQFPVGISNLVIIPTAECHIEIDWHERDYI